MDERKTVFNPVSLVAAGRHRLHHDQVVVHVASVGVVGYAHILAVVVSICCPAERSPKFFYGPQALIIEARPMVVLADALSQGMVGAGPAS